jgi:hypothetical protein
MKQSAASDISTTRFISIAAAIPGSCGGTDCCLFTQTYGWICFYDSSTTQQIDDTYVALAHLLDTVAIA